MCIVILLQILNTCSFDNESCTFFSREYFKNMHNGSRILTEQQEVMSDIQSVICAQYHECIRSFSVDIIKLEFPKLRRNCHITHGTVEACADNKCRICSPLTVTTIEKIRTYVTKMYRLMTGNNACNTDWTDNEHTNDFRSNKWLLNYDKAVSVAGNVLGDGRSVNAREQMERLRSLAQMCDAIHSDEYLAMAKRYRAEVDRIDKERKQVRPAAVESKEEAIADLKRIRQALRTEWEAIKDSLDPKRIDDLLYCCTVFGLGENDTFAPIRTDWWRASYKPDVIVPGIGKPCNYIDMTGEDVWLRVPECSKEPTNSVELNISEESPLLATLLRAYKDTALEKNDGFLFSPCKMSARNSRRPRAMIKLLRPPVPSPHENQCTRCHETFVCGKNGRRECECTRNGKRSRPECGSYCGPACGHYTNIQGRHKRVCSELGNVQEREALASNMGTSLTQMQRYGNGSGTVV